MPDIRTQSFLYHLTSIQNMPNILANGLMPRRALRQFEDVADAEIIGHRKIHGLDSQVPFHFFAKNPFDGRVQTMHPQKEFVLIAVRRNLAKDQNWRIIPKHPLAVPFSIFGYDDGFNRIDWQTMNRRDYQDHTCKQICMAECLAPTTVPCSQFACLYVKDGSSQARVQHLLNLHNLTTPVYVNANMFYRGR